MVSPRRSVKNLRDESILGRLYPSVLCTLKALWARMQLSYITLRKGSSSSFWLRHCFLYYPATVWYVLVNLARFKLTNAALTSTQLNLTQPDSIRLNLT